MTVEFIIRRIFEDLTPDGKRYIIALIIAGTVLGAGVSIYLVPSNEVETVVKLPPAAAVMNESAKNESNSLMISKPVVLHSPFSPMHEEREQISAGFKPDTGKVPAGKTEQAKVGKEPLRLVGTARSSTGAAAIFERGTEHWSMVVGEKRGGVELVELTESGAVVETSDGTLTLRLPGR